MKRVFILCCFITTAACNSVNEEDTNKPDAEMVSTNNTIDNTNEPPAYNPETDLYIWHSTTEYKKIKNPNQVTLINADSLIRGLNEYYEHIFLQKNKIGGDTLYVQVKDNQYLGNQMGSTGAEMWLADVVLNLTEVPGIKYIHIDMDTANHIMPGTWSAAQFNKYTPVLKK